MTDLKALAEAAKAATSDNWFHGEYSDIEYAPPKGDENGAHWFPVADELAPVVCDYLIAAQPSAILALYAERDAAYLTSQQSAQSYSNLMRVKDDIDAQRQAAEAALASYKEEVERLRAALADLVSWFPEKPTEPEWRIKAGAYGADDALSAARDITKEPPHAE